MSLAADSKVGNDLQLEKIIAKSFSRVLVEFLIIICSPLEEPLDIFLVSVLETFYVSKKFGFYSNT